VSAVLLQTPTGLLEMPAVSDLDRAVFAAPLFQSGALAQLFRDAGLAYGSAHRSFQKAVTDCITFGDHPIARSRLCVDRKISNIFG